MTPTVGRIVHVIVKPDGNNGSDVAPAIITRVRDQAGDRWIVNYRIVLDGPGTPWVTSAHLYPDEEAARASGNVDGLAAFWPPRA